jgi:hypothetical protein
VTLRMFTFLCHIIFSWIDKSVILKWAGLNKILVGSFLGQCPVGWGVVKIFLLSLRDKGGAVSVYLCVCV